MWSMLNAFLEKDVTALLNHEALQDDLKDDERAMTKETCEAVIHAALWAYGSRSGSTASGYALKNLYHSLRLKSWTYEERAPEPQEAPR